MSGVFLSYRREDSRAQTVRLSKHLGLRFDDGLIFRDEEDIKAGVKWYDAIMDVIADCDAFLLVIGPKWLEARNSAGQRRLDDPDDVLLNEILRALSRDLTVIPVLLDETEMPPRAKLVSLGAMWAGIAASWSSTVASHSSAISRKRNFWIFPLTVIGKSSTIHTYRGTL